MTNSFWPPIVKCACCIKASWSFWRNFSSVPFGKLHTSSNCANTPIGF